MELEAIVWEKEELFGKEEGVSIKSVWEGSELEGGMPEVAVSHEGGLLCSSMCMIVPGKRSVGKESRCSTKVTWKELNTLPEAGFHRW
jgi:hypothetical protein